MAKIPRQDKYFGSHEHLTREDEIKTSSNRSFGFVFAAFCFIVGALSWWSGHTLWPYWFVAAASFFLVALVLPRILSPFNRLWTKFGLLLGAVVAPIMLAVIFYAFVTPIGLLMRATGKDPLRLKLDPDADSYWIARDNAADAKTSFKNQY
jgi:hypothetical protein